MASQERGNFRKRNKGFHPFQFSERNHTGNDDLLTALRKQEQNTPTRKRTKRFPRKDHDTQGESSRGSTPIRVEQNALIDRKRSVSKEEVIAVKKAEDACRAAIALNKECIRVSMRQSYVGSRCFMNIEANWLRRNIPDNVRDITLRMGERTWETRIQRRESGRGPTGGLNTGWGRFVADNSLEEYDNCVFTLGEHVDGGRIVLDVQVFRLADQKAEEYERVVMGMNPNV